MLAIPPSTSSDRHQHLTPNILPCTIKHSGRIPISKRHWSPTPSTTTTTTSSTASQEPEKQTRTSYFRGRKLHGRKLKIPNGYYGVVLQKTDKPLPSARPTAQELRRLEEDDEMDTEDGREEEVEVKLMEEVGRFEEIVVWGHEVVPADGDVYVRGVEEWVGFAEAMHSYDEPAS